jgi:hypothetical protein
VYAIDVLSGLKGAPEANRLTFTHPSAVVAIANAAIAPAAANGSMTVTAGDATDLIIERIFCAVTALAALAFAH